MSRPRRKPQAREKVDRDLTTKERLFVHYYLGEAQNNATEAARRAGYSSPRQQASRLLSNVAVRKVIEARLETVGMSNDEILARLAAMAAADPMEFVTIGKDNAPRIDLAKAKRSPRSFLVRSVEVKRDGSVKLVMHNAQDALDRLARIGGLFANAEPQKPAEPIDPRIAAALLDAAERLGGNGESSERIPPGE